MQVRLDLVQVLGATDISILQGGAQNAYTDYRFQYDGTTAASSLVHSKHKYHTVFAESKSEQVRT